MFICDEMNLPHPAALLWFTTVGMGLRHGATGLLMDAIDSLHRNYAENVVTEKELQELRAALMQMLEDPTGEKLDEWIKVDQASPDDWTPLFNLAMDWVDNCIERGDVGDAYFRKHAGKHAFN